MSFSGSLPRLGMSFIWMAGLLICSHASSLSMGDAFDRDIVDESRRRSQGSSTNLRRILQQRNRELATGIFDARCERFINSTVEGIFPRQDCVCEPKIFPPSLDINCQLAETANFTRCFPPNTNVLCGRPGITASLNLLSALTGGLIVRVDLCFYDATLFGFPVPKLFNPYCINVLGSISGSPSIPSIIQAIFGIFSPGVKADTSLTSDTLGTCKAMLGSKKCQSCSVCSARMGGGVRMDCSNLVPKFVVDECTVLPSFLDVKT